MPVIDNEAKQIQHSILEIEKVDSMIIELPFDHNYYSSLDLQVYSRGDSSFLMFSDIDHEVLIEVSLESKSVTHVVPIDFPTESRKYSVFSFEVIGNDSILLIDDKGNYGFDHDDSMFLIDFQGRRLAIYDLTNTPFRLASYNDERHDLTYNHRFQPITLCDNNWITTPDPKNVDNYSLFQLQMEAGHFIGIVDFGKNPVTYDTLEFQPVDVNNTTWSGAQATWSMTNAEDSEVVLARNHEPEFYLLNLASGNYRSSRSNGSLLDAPFGPSDSFRGVDRIQYYTKSSCFSTLLYNQNQRIIYRFASLPVKHKIKLQTYFDFISETQWVGAYDEDLLLFAQGLKPYWFIHENPKPVFYKNSILSIKKLDAPSNQLTIYQSKTHFKSVSESDWVSFEQRIFKTPIQDKDHDISSYIKDLQIPNDAILLVVPVKSCPACIEYSVAHFIENLEDMEANNIYLLTDNSLAIKSLSSTTSENVIVDDKKDLEYYLDATIDNPKLIKWTNGKVMKRIILPPSAISRIDMYYQAIMR